MRINRAIASISALVLLLSGCASTSTSSSVASAPVTTCDFPTGSTPNQLPNLKMPCLTSTGYTTEQFSLHSLKGPLVINLWGSWCPPCREEMPLFRDLYLATEKTKALSIVGVDVEESSPKDALNFMSEQGMVWPQFADNTQVTRADFGMGVPVTWFVNAKGEVTYRQVGQIHSWAQMQGLIQMHLGITVSS
ncbi:thiol-disulfide oxidoreductase ResA [mine drainage metagenome]|uniref:Thiol-disulfide oxidoreductase ResA n=1 Tax=mine drainage metagenome TaxID=410659 RepID=A0A1J5QNG9_9ZZZZ